MDACADPRRRSDPASCFHTRRKQCTLRNFLKEGVHLRRLYRYARGQDGSTYVWMARNRSVGKGEGRSGLRFDFLDFS